MSESSNEGWRADELEWLGHCPLCSRAENARPRHAGLSDLLEGTPGRWNYHDCPGCGCLYLDPRPTPVTIGRAYASYYTHDSADVMRAADNGRGLMWKLANAYMRVRYGACREPALSVGAWLLPWLPPLRQQLDYFYRHLPLLAGGLLDVGCGNGVFLRRARAAGWQVIGLEPDPSAVTMARADGLEVLQGTLDDDLLPAHRFDVLSAAHVLEHVHDPLKFLQRAAALLRPGGLVWLATPNVGSLGHRWFGGDWRGMEPPRHLVLFRARTLSRLLRQAGFTDIRFHRRGRGASYILQTSRQLTRRAGHRRWPLPAMLVDILATLSSRAGEELVVTARKPAP